mgnify:CR=1 FL=1
MKYVAYTHEPHQTHRMGRYESDIVILPNGSDRFARTSECQKCGGRDWKAGGAGSRWMDVELLYPCTISEASWEEQEQ